MAKVFVIDDDLEFLDEITKALRQNGFIALALASAVTAFEAIVDQKPDIILLDMKMDEVDGFDLLSRLANCAETQRIPVIAMTAFYTARAYRVLMGSSGVKECLVKPFDPESLIYTINRILRVPAKGSPPK